MTADLDRYHSITLESREGPSLATEEARALIPEALEDLRRRHPPVRVEGWRSEERRIDLLLDLGRSDEDLLRLTLHLKRVLRERLGRGLQWSWSNRELCGADPEQRAAILRAWESDSKQVS